MMNRTVTVAVICVTLGLAVRASEKPAAPYQEAMKNLGAANADLRKDVVAIESAGAYPDYNPIEKDAATFKASFTTALAFWTTKGSDDAVSLLQKGLKLVDDLEMARKEKNYDALMTAAAELGKMCGACHTAHRERLPDGTFEIK